MMKKVMIKAVELAKKMEGDWVARMKMALKMAWALFKKGVNQMAEYPKVVAERIQELLDTGDQPTKQFAKNKAIHEYNELLSNIKKIKGDQVDLTPYKQALNQCSLERYKNIMMEFGYYARQK